MSKLTKLINIYCATILVLFSVCNGYAQAQDIKVLAEISSKTISLGSAATVVIRINGTQNVSPITFPDIEGIEDRYLGPSRQVSIVNGQYTSSISFSYSLLPLQVGSFTIPAIEIPLEGSLFKTEPIILKVVDENNVLTENNDTPEKTLEDRINLSVQLPKKKVYLNEKVPVKIYLSVSNLTVKDIQYPQLENIGIITSGFEQPKRLQRVVDGVRYEILEFNTDIFPMRTGVLEIGPATLDCSIVVGTSSPFKSNSSFNDDFFNSFFKREKKQGLKVQSNALSLEVIDLPEKERPEAFSGGVGDFEFDVSISPTQLKEGDPITLKMSIKGKNNETLQSIKFPKLNEPEKFKLYDPIIKEENKVKTLEQVVIPISSEVTEIPEIEFGYFNPSLEKYQSIKKGPFKIVVEKLQDGGNLTMVGGAVQNNYIQSETLGEDIVYLKDDIGKIQKRGHRLYKNAFFYILILIALGLWIATYILYKRALKLQTDSVYARRVLAPKEAKASLENAKSLIVLNKGNEYYDRLFKAFEHYLASKLCISSGAIDIDTIEQKLKNYPKAMGIMPAIVKIYQDCEMVRFASITITEEQMLKSFVRVEQVIDHMERSIK